jgi:hypothetical protein
MHGLTQLVVLIHIAQALRARLSPGQPLRTAG